MKINAHASQTHFYERIRPIWELLPKRIRGRFTVHQRLDGLPFTETARPDNEDVLLVASHVDSQYSDKFIYIEHGAGQSYDPKDFYSTAHRPNMLAALVPGPYCAEKTRLANPDTPVFEIGLPHLRNLHREPQKIAFAWHWRCGIAIEAGTAFDEYEEAMSEAARLWPSIGHGHPRIMGELSMIYPRLGLETVFDSKEVLSRAALLVADNTSLIYEAAALDIPVILVNSRDWRRERNWGLRFWDVLPGPWVDSPEDLVPTIERELDGEWQDWAEQRRSVTKYVYGETPFGPLSPVIEQLVDMVDAYAAFN